MILRTTLWRSSIFSVLLFCALFSCNSLHAQYVAIPDSGFNAWLNINYPGCMVHDSLDTTCTDILIATSLNTSYQAISSLEGVQYFKALDSLYCDADTTLTYIPALAKTLRVLECRNNALTSLPPLPDSLWRLACEFNLLDSLPRLPDSLVSITCYNNNLTALPALPNGLKALYCSGNQLTSLPAIPDSLVVLSCYSNKLSQLPSTLDNVLRDLVCSDNLLTSLPALPNSIRDLDCYKNRLSSLPALPDSLQSLVCSYNQLSTLPTLPNSLTLINCEYNSLTSLPALPDSLYQFFLDNNPNLHCLPQLNTIVDFEFYNTGISCWPNVGNIYTSNPDTLSICDSTNNPNNCLEISAVKEITKPVFSLYPNPAQNFVTLVIDANTIGGIVKISDNTGRLLSSAKLKMASSKIDVSNLAAGFYLVSISDPQGRTAVSKLVVE